MIARLLMALLLAVVSLPSGSAADAAAMPDCHAGAAMPEHGVPAPAAPARAEHACIGCVPVNDWLSARIPAPIAAAPLPPHAVVRRLDLGGIVTPALPPPRTA